MVQGDYASLFEAVNTGGSCVGGRCGGNGEEGAIPGVAGGWPLVDETRGMILFVMDYQTVNLRCRDGVRKVRKRKRGRHLPFGENMQQIAGNHTVLLFSFRENTPSQRDVCVERSFFNE